MEHSLTRSTARPLTEIAVLGAPHALRRLLPLWRYAAFGAALFAVMTAGAMVRLEVQQLRKDLDRTRRAGLDARVLNERLTLESDARSRTLAMEASATALGLTAAAQLESLALQPGSRP